MEYWHVQIEAWPHSTGRGDVKDQETCGNRVRDFEVKATTFREACRLAEAIADGVKSGPNCWQAVIVKVAVQKRHTIPKDQPDPAYEAATKARLDHESVAFGGGPG